MLNLPTHQQIDNALNPSEWSFGNDILYDLCRNNFSHIKPDVIIAKVLFIGRVYAAAVERRRNKEEDINDDFYLNTIVPALKNSSLDSLLESLKSSNNLSVENITPVLETHFYLTQLLFRITNLNKRSFSSKYLHFHLPEMFFIFDSRVVKALRFFISSVTIDKQFLTRAGSSDKEYAQFFCKCFHLKRSIEDHYHIKMTNRQLDNLLIHKANQINR